MTDEQATVRWSPLRRWTLGILALLVVVALFVFAPTPVFQIVQTNNARALVNYVATGRDDLLGQQGNFRTPLARLGDPVQSWTQVSCWLKPRTSDGDGETGRVMFYWQECALVATEVYAVPPDWEDSASVAAVLRSSPAGEGTCDVSLYGVLTPDLTDSTIDDYDTDLRWVDPEGDPPADQPWRCDLPTPDDPDTAHVTIDVDEPMTADAYVVFQVRSPVSQTDVGCDRTLTWLAPCTGEPDGFPAL